MSSSARLSMTCKGVTYCHRLWLRRLHVRVQIDTVHQPPPESHEIEVANVTAQLAPGVEYPTYGHADASRLNIMPHADEYPGFGSYLDFKSIPFRPAKWRISNYHESVKERTKMLGPVWRERFFGYTVVHLAHPEFFRTVLQVTAYDTDDTTKQLSLFRNGESWHLLRSALRELMLRPKESDHYFPLVSPVVDEFCARLAGSLEADGLAPNLWRDLLRWQMESSANLLFEERLGALAAPEGSDSEVARFISSTFDALRLSARLKFGAPFYKFRATPALRALADKDAFVASYTQKLAEAALGRLREMVARGKLEPPGSFYLIAHLCSQERLNFLNVCTILQSLFASGLTTTVPTLVYNLYCLATNPRVQEKLCAEMQSVICSGDGDGDVLTPAHLDKMVYLKACIKETFRMFPTVMQTSRVPEKNLVCGGFQINAGTHVSLDHYVLYRDPAYFAKPDEFSPERWMRGGSAQNVDPFLVTPFGYGPRMCVGRRFAELELSLMLVRILQRYRVEWASAEPLKQKYEIFLLPSTNPQFRFAPHSS